MHNYPTSSITGLWKAAKFLILALALMVVLAVFFQIDTDDAHAQSQGVLAALDTLEVSHSESSHLESDKNYDMYPDHFWGNDATHYRVVVPHSVDTATVKAVGNTGDRADTSNVTVTWNGQQISGSSDEYTVSGLEVGDNIVNIHISATKGTDTATRDMTLNIIRGTCEVDRTFVPADYLYRGCLYLGVQELFNLSNV